MITLSCCMRENNRIQDFHINSLLIVDRRIKGMKSPMSKNPAIKVKVNV